uniref:Uncharacterized protein n=1 Tax=viral metagenome TaxID=1070528 RepID=A0A6C0DDY5_9ZZZZ
MFSHIRFLESQMQHITHIPTQFEYYSAIHLTKLHQIRFYAYKDIPENHKRDAGFPIYDKGVDLIDETFRHIVQVKYYGPKRKIVYGHLATFFGTPVLVGRKHLNLTLVRTNHSKLHSEIQQIIKRGDLTDVPLCPYAFLKTL